MRLFAYRLALALGRVDVDAMLAAMSADQLKEWMEYYRYEPWGQERADYRSAIVAHTVAVSAGAQRKDKRPLRIADFLPEFGPPKPVKKQTAQDIKNMFKAMYGSRMVRAPKPEGA